LKTARAYAGACIRRTRNYNYGEWTVSVGYRHQLTGNREGEDINVTQVALLMATWARRFGPQLHCCAHPGRGHPYRLKQPMARAAAV